MSKVTKDNVVETSEEVKLAQSVVVNALDPVYNKRGQLSYGFNVILDNVTYTFRTDQQGLLELNDSGTFTNSFVLSE